MTLFQLQLQLLILKVHHHLLILDFQQEQEIQDQVFQTLLAQHLKVHKDHPVQYHPNLIMDLVPLQVEIVALILVIIIKIMLFIKPLNHHNHRNHQLYLELQQIHIKVCFKLSKTIHPLQDLY
jgi:hypothetical protein